MKIQHKKFETNGVFYVEENDKHLAEMMYSDAGDRIIISHTEVDSSLKGKGIGKQLVSAAVSYARENNIKIIPLCPFARSVFQKTPDYSDVL